MDNEKYITMLLDSSFKEANLFWIRNSAFSIFQSILIGFAFNTNLKETILWVLVILGILFCFIHLVIIVLSKRLNLFWFNSLKSYIDSLKKSEKNKNWIKHFKNLITDHESIRFKFFDIFFLTKLIPIIFIILWILIIFK